MQNRRESTIRSLAVAIENTAAAESQIRDIDFASETVELTRNQVLQQAGVSILGQPNVSTPSALSLLGQTSTTVRLAPIAPQSSSQVGGASFSIFLLV